MFLVVAHRCGRRPSLWAREKGEGLYSETADEGMLQAASMPYETASPCYAISASDASSLGGSSESGLCVRAHAGRLWTSWPPTWCALRVGGAAWLAARCRGRSFQRGNGTQYPILRARHNTARNARPIGGDHDHGRPYTRARHCCRHIHCSATNRAVHFGLPTITMCL